MLLFHLQILSFWHNVDAKQMYMALGLNIFISILYNMYNTNISHHYRTGVF